MTMERTSDRVNRVAADQLCFVLPNDHRQSLAIPEVVALLL